MGEVMYGSGLRLMELLRLRVHHLDLARGQISVYAGKGGEGSGYGPAGLHCPEVGGTFGCAEGLVCEGS